MLEGYTDPRLPRGAHQHGRAAAADDRGHLPAPGPARQDRRHPRRALRRPGRARHRRRLVRARAPRPRRPVPAAGRAVRAARGDAAHRAPDVERRRRAVRGHPLPARGDDLRPAAAAPRAGDGRRQRRAQDAAPGRDSTPTPATSCSAGTTPRPRPGTSSRCSARTARTSDARTTRSGAPSCCPGRWTPPATPTASSRGWTELASVGVQEVHVVPLGAAAADPVGFVRDLGAHVVPHLSRI